MIDFQNSAFIKLKQVKPETFSGMISPMLLSDEKIMSTYQASATVLSLLINVFL